MSKPEPCLEIDPERVGWKRTPYKGVWITPAGKLFAFPIGQREVVLIKGMREPLRLPRITRRFQ